MAKDEKEIGMVKLDGCRCRCGHEWLPRDKSEKPRVCPKCKSPNWDRPVKTRFTVDLTQLSQAKRKKEQAASD